jgi:hypothetical protein
MHYAHLKFSFYFLFEHKHRNKHNPLADSIADTKAMGCTRDCCGFEVADTHVDQSCVMNTFYFTASKEQEKTSDNSSASISVVAALARAQPPRARRRVDAIEPSVGTRATVGHTGAGRRLIAAATHTSSITTL